MKVVHIAFSGGPDHSCDDWNPGLEVVEPAAKFSFRPEITGMSTKTRYNSISSKIRNDKLL